MSLAPGGAPQAAAVSGVNYRYTDPDPRTLSIIVGSGGGTRAATFMLGVLRTLDALCLQMGPDKCAFSALDHVDMISTVSGSSLTSGYWAVHGREKFNKLEKHLRNSGFWDIFWRYMNPENGVGTWFPAKSQIDVLIERFASDDAFDGAGLGEVRFAGLAPRPQLILNATDMSSKTTFAFTPQNFFHLCAELSQFKVVDAVAASAAFPIAFGALSLRNQSYDPERPGRNGANSCPTGYVEPAWIEDTLSASVAGLVGDRSEFRRAERLRSYSTNACAFSENVRNADGALLPRCVEWLHLLDGGIVDNLGITEPLWLVTNVHSEFKANLPYGTPYSLQEANRPAETRHLITGSIAAQIFEGHIERIVVLLANVRSNTPGDYISDPENPGWGPQIGAVVGGSIDSVSDLLVGKIAGRGSIYQSLLEEVCEYLEAVEANFSRPSCEAFFNPAPGAEAAMPALSPDVLKRYQAIQTRLKNLRVRIVPLDFDMIGRECSAGAIDPEVCIPEGQGRELRKYFQAISTTWWLKDFEIDRLLKLPACMLSASSVVKELVGILPKQGGPDSDPARDNAREREIVDTLSRTCTYPALYKEIATAP